MKVKQIGTNKTEIQLTDEIQVLYSYETPVAIRRLTPEGMTYYRTNQYYSRTTTKHIGSWLPLNDAKILAQSEIDRLVK